MEIINVKVRRNYEKNNNLYYNWSRYILIFDWKLHLTTKDNYEYLFELKKDGNGLSGWYYNATASRPNPLNAEYLLDNPFFTYVGLPVDVIYEN